MDLLSPAVDFEELVERVNRGEVFLYPTDTVAGIGCIANNKESVDRIFAIKSRDSKKSVSFAFADIDQMSRYVEIPEISRPFLQLLPGALTLVLEQKQNSPEIYGIYTSTIGVRIPNVPWLLKLVSKINIPIVTTSANVSGEQPQAIFEKTDQSLLNQIDFAIPWDDELKTSSSTVISIIQDKIILLREGAISKEELNRLRTHTF